MLNSTACLSSYKTETHVKTAQQDTLCVLADQRHARATWYALCMLWPWQQAHTTRLREHERQPMHTSSPSSMPRQPDLHVAWPCTHNLRHSSESVCSGGCSDCHKLACWQLKTAGVLQLCLGQPPLGKNVAIIGASILSARTPWCWPACLSRPTALPGVASYGSGLVKASRPRSIPYCVSERLL